MFSVQVECKRKGVILFLAYENFMEASNCIMAIKRVLRGRYSICRYFETARITSKPLGELLNEVPLESDYAMIYQDRMEK